MAKRMNSWFTKKAKEKENCCSKIRAMPEKIELPAIVIST